MAYLVNINARAERDLADLYDAIDAGSSDAARHWYAGLKQAIFDLGDNPHIWPVTHEARRLRHILYGRKPHSVYRVIYRVFEKWKIVEVLHVRDGARSQFRISDLK